VQLWLVVLGSFGVLLSILLAGAVRLEFEGRAFGEPSGAWACAFGIDLGPFAVSGVVGRGAPHKIELHLLGRRFRVPSRSSRAKTKGAKTKGRAGAGSWLSPLRAVELLIGERRRVLVEALLVDAAYGFEDIVLTGRIAGVLSALSGILPSGIVITQRPSWEGAERWEVDLTGRVRLWPGLVLLDVLWYMIRTRTGRSRPGDNSARPTPPPLQTAS
jgi:hypothetical protein